jgi:transcriptional antiterminator Rof (Rho-off)
MNDYRPIACASYDLYEIAIMRRQTLLLAWRDEAGNAHQQRVRPLDLRIIDGAEYLIAGDDDDNTLQLRLDHIFSAEPESS